MPSLEPLKGFKYGPWPSVSTLAMFEAFFKYNSFPIALFVAFCAKADPTPLNAPVANVGRTVFAKKGKAFAAKPARNPRDPPSIFILWTTWRLLIFIVMPFPSEKLLSFCSLVNWSKQEHYLHHTSLHVQDECSWGFLYQQRVSIFGVDFQKYLLIRLCKTYLLYEIIFLSSGIWLSGFLHEDSIAFCFGLWQLFPFYWFYLNSLEDTQGFSGSQRFYIQAKHLEKNCKLCFAFSHSHKTTNHIHIHENTNYW